MRFLALASLFFLTACSYDPYHYYYDCEGVNSQGVKTSALFYRHDKTVNWMGVKFEFVSETETLILYESPSLKSETISAALLKLSKVDDSVVIDILHVSDPIFANFECTVDKRFFKDPNTFLSD